MSKSSTRVVLSGAIITLRARKLKSGKFESLYLDYYHNGERIYKFLKIYLYANPRTPEERESNEMSKKAAIEERTIQESQIMQSGLTNSLVNSKALFIPYFEMAMKNPKDDGRKKKKNTIDAYIAVMNLIKKKYGEQLTFLQINEEWCKGFRSYLLDTYDITTARMYLARLGTILGYAVKDKIIVSNPVAYLPSISSKEVSFEWLSWEELVLLKNTECELPDLKRAALASAQIGLRAGDVIALKWKNVKHSNERGYYIDFIQEKADNQNIIPIKDSVMELFGKRGGDEDRVFPDFKNDVANNTALRIWLLSAGIKKRLTFHDFRHTHAILIAEKGANLFQIKEILGHKSIGTTERYYARLIDSAKKQILDKLPDL